MRLLRRFWPLALLLAAIAIAWASGLPQQISWASLGRNQVALSAWVASHPVAAPAVYIVIYAVTVALSLPESAVLTVGGGLLFGTLLGGLLAIAGSTIGAIALFMGVRYHLADAIAARGGRFLDRFSYLLAVRLVPAFPFWLINLAAGLSGMRLAPYAAATVIGIAPASFVYASIGAGIGEVLEVGGRPDLAVIFSPHILGPLVALAALSLLPVVWRHWKRSNA
jgi:uncharacterized membrane protein YdjX (TVP38/TMEM64 family)